ncbi:hypothetical protein LG634_09350 [Streptomyces bambusae]|uniref:hypothetical protein n=1 Tax=Streptomyces bambusae TaxID=1550616 RepID=UPI001CFDD27E|nr:hypothetical protein [Streptomyces bambusae]MCB5165032.1 hypothetical protein [Streptomyces bambusae]
MATALAAVGNRLVFGGTLSATACLVAVLALFAVALPRAGRPRSLSTGLSAMVLAQAATCWWLGHLGDAPTPSVALAHDGPWGVSYAALTLVVGWTLHAAEISCTWVGTAVHDRLGDLAVRLRSLFVPWPTSYGPQSPRPPVGRQRRDAGPSPYELLLADAVVRRGPPTRPTGPRLPEAPAAVGP